MDALLVHRATVYTKTQSKSSGRVTDVWSSAGVIRCRFTLPSLSTTSTASGANEPVFTTNVFAGLEIVTPNSTIASLPDVLNSALLPVRFVTTDTPWAGTYEMRQPPRAYTSWSETHHIEFGVVKVSE